MFLIINTFLLGFESFISEFKVKGCICSFNVITISIRFKKSDIFINP